jgi:hypothetical protein
MILRMILRNRFMRPKEECLTRVENSNEANCDNRPDDGDYDSYESDRIWF